MKVNRVLVISLLFGLMSIQEVEAIQMKSHQLQHQKAHEEDDQETNQTTKAAKTAEETAEQMVEEDTAAAKKTETTTEVQETTDEQPEEGAVTEKKKKSEDKEETPDAETNTATKEATEEEDKEAVGEKADAKVPGMVNPKEKGVKKSKFKTKEAKEKEADEKEEQEEDKVETTADTAGKQTGSTDGTKMYPKKQKKPTAEDTKISGYNGADEDEIMEKVIKQYSDHAKDSTNNETPQLLLSKKKARRSAEVILEGTHKLNKDDVPEWLAKNFNKAWKHYDQNDEGWLRYEECHTFMRYLMGPLNKLTMAPGSIADLETGGKKYKLNPKAEKTAVKHV